MKFHNSFLIIFFLSFTLEKIECQENRVSVNRIFNIIDRIRLRHFFNRLRRVLSPDVIQRVEEYEIITSMKEGNTLKKMLEEKIQDEKKVKEIIFFVEMLSYIIEPLTKNFNTTSINHILNIIPKQMETIYNSYPDSVRNNYGKLQVTEKEWDIVSNILFKKYDKFLTDAQTQFHHFTYSRHDKNLLSRLFEFFVAIMAEKYESLNINEEIDDLLSNGKNGLESLSTTSTPLANILSYDDHIESSIEEEIVKDISEIAHKNGSQFSHTRKAAPEPNKMIATVSLWMDRIKRVINIFRTIFRTGRGAYRFILRTVEFFRNIYEYPADMVRNFSNLFENASRYLNPINVVGDIANKVLHPFSSLFSSTATSTEPASTRQRIFNGVSRISNRILSTFNPSRNNNKNLDIDVNANIDSIIPKPSGATNIVRSAISTTNSIIDRVTQPIRRLTRTITSPVTSILDGIFG